MDKQRARPGAFTIDEFAKTFRIGRSTVYEILDSGELKSFHVGRRRLISFSAADEWQRMLEEKSDLGRAAREPQK
jgi:excisionase family DNA binding protein